MEDRFSKVREILEPPWDEVREQRVLARIQAKRREPRRSRRAWPWVVGAAAAALALLGIAVWRLGGRRSTGGPELPAGFSQRISFGRDAFAMLGPRARVDILRNTPSEVRVRQVSGRVRYVVRHRPGRRFVVQAAGVLIRDVGTEFTVEIRGRRHVRVSVQEGAVEVSAGGRWHRVEAGASFETKGAAGGNSGITTPTRVSDGGVGSTPSRQPQGKTPPSQPQRSSARSAGRPSGRPPARNRAGSREDIASLFRRVDEARRAGRLAEAARLLGQIIRNHPGDPRVTAALFTLGRVYRALGRHASAAQAFRRCRKRAPRGPLAEDALAAEAKAWAQAGRAETAKRAAARYCRLYPRGTHRRAMEKLLGGHCGDERGPAASAPSATRRASRP